MGELLLNIGAYILFVLIGSFIIIIRHKTDDNHKNNRIYKLIKTFLFIPVLMLNILLCHNVNLTADLFKNKDEK